MWRRTRPGDASPKGAANPFEPAMVWVGINGGEAAWLTRFEPTSRAPFGLSITTRLATTPTAGASEVRPGDANLQGTAFHALSGLRNHTFRINPSFTR